MMKRLDRMLLVAAGVLGLAACGGGTKPAQNASSVGQQDPPAAADDPPQPESQASHPRGNMAQQGQMCPQGQTCPPGQMGQQGQPMQGQMNRGCTRNQMGSGQMNQMGPSQMGPAQQMRPGTSHERMGPRAGQSAQPRSTGSASMQGTPGGTSALDDSQLAAVLQAIHQDDIQESLLAQNKAQAPTIKRFARDLTAQDRMAQDKEAALFTRLQITPTESPVVQQLRGGAQEMLSHMHEMRGADFDHCYMDDVVATHREELRVLDGAIPNVGRPELKMHAEQLRARLASELAEAERIQQSLGTGSTNEQAPAQPGAEPPNMEQPDVEHQ